MSELSSVRASGVMEKEQRTNPFREKMKWPRQSETTQTEGGTVLCWLLKTKVAQQGHQGLFRPETYTGGHQLRKES